MRSILRSFAALASSGILALASGCAEPPESGSSDHSGSDQAVPPAGDEPLGTTAQALTTSDVIACAEEWVADQVPYCGGVNGGTDYICGGVCHRPSAAWDGFRSDCSGFVSWCWQIPSDPTTYSYMNDNGGANGWQTIAIADLQAGDAVVCDGHIKIFSQFVSSNQAEVYEESNCGKVAHKSVQTFTQSGQTLKFQYDTRVYHAIRRNGILPPVRVDGYVDSATDVVKGWAADLDASAQPVTVDLYFGGGPADGFGVQVVASEARPDVASALGIDPNHGFTVATPHYYCDGNAHPVFGFGHAVKDGTAVALTQTATSVNCPVPKAPDGLLRHVANPDVLNAWSFDVRRQLSWMTPDDRAAHDLSTDWPNERVLAQTPDGWVWVVDEGKRRHVIDPTSFAAWGFDPSMLVQWTDADAAKYTLGLDLPPAPLLVEQVGDPAVYVLDVDPRHLSGPPSGGSGGGAGSTGTSPSSGSGLVPGDDGSMHGTTGCSVGAPSSDTSSSTGAASLLALAAAAGVKRRRRTLH